MILAGGRRQALAALSPGKAGGWVGPRAGLDWCGVSPLSGLESRTVQPVAVAIAAQLKYSTNDKSDESKPVIPTLLLLFYYYYYYFIFYV